MKYRYYIPYLIHNSETGANGFGYSFTERDRPIETQSDIEGLIEDFENALAPSPSKILLLPWIRLD